MEQLYEELATKFAELQQQQTFVQEQVLHLQLQQQQHAQWLANVNHPVMQVPSNPLLQALDKVKLPTYSGDTESDELDTWIFHMQEYFNANPGSTPAQQVRLAGMHLRGQAATWWRDLCQNTPEIQPQDFHTFAEEIKSMFLPVGRVKLARDKLATAKQRNSETLASYTSYMRRLFLTVPNLTEDDKLDRYIRGLQPHLRTATYLDEPTTFEAAAQIAAKHDSLRQSLFEPTTWQWPITSQHSRTSEDASGYQPMELGAIQGERSNRHS